MRMRGSSERRVSSLCGAHLRSYAMAARPPAVRSLCETEHAVSRGQWAAVLALAGADVSQPPLVRSNSVCNKLMGGAATSTKGFRVRANCSLTMISLSVLCTHCGCVHCCYVPAAMLN